jgi:hypothetical protein
MINSKYLLFVPIIMMISSCSGLKLKNISDCDISDINKKEIEDLLKKRGHKIREAVIRKVYSENLSNAECEGLFYIEVLNWKGIKTSRNYVAIPLIMTRDTLFVNSSYHDGKKVNNTNDIEVELVEIQNKMNGSFTKEQLEIIKNKYKYGIDICPGGRFF